MAELRKTANKTVGLARFQIENVGKTMPFTIGVDLADGTVYPLIAKGEKLPVHYEQIFTSANSFEMRADMPLVLGERPLGADNELLCNVTINSGSFRMAGKSQYRLHVDVEEDGIIAVYCNEPDTGNAIKADIGFNEEVITQDMVAAIEEASRAGAEEDAMNLELLEKMRALDKRIAEVHNDYWPAAKRKMGFFDKRKYKNCRHSILVMLREGPSEMNSEKLENLAELVREFDEWEPKLVELHDQVMKWYEK